MLGFPVPCRNPRKTANPDDDIHPVIQQDIARDISDSLRLRLNANEKSKLVRPTTQNADAYQLYLKGQYFLFKVTEEDGKKAVRYFQQAIDADSNYALAYTGLATAYEAFSGTTIAPKEAIPKAKEAVKTARRPPKGNTNGRLT